MERKDIVTMKGNPVTLVGPALKPGDQAPGFTVLDQELKPVTLEDLGDALKVISVTPSLDTPVCDLQAHRFNDEAVGLPGDVVVLNISMDLPFAIKRFCLTEEINNIRVLSDHREASFGTAYGVLMKELRLLARSVFIIDPENTIRYIEVVHEATHHPEYDGALAAAKRQLR
ncbi:MAG: thiol peroxidase [Synergistales bacterium]|nr:thiol peroxidase [Synergistales bacterium]